jgi:hypothetical protein
MRMERVMKRSLLSSLVLGPVLLLVALCAPVSVAAADPLATPCTAVGTNVTCNLWARTGSLALPGGSVAVWGYSSTAGGSPAVPGPLLIVNQGDQVTVNLTNDLSRPTAILFAGQAIVPDQSGIAAGGSGQYVFTAGQPGTYLYEAGLIPGSQYQSAMGLHGVLVVRPAGAPTQAYSGAATAFDDEAVVVLEDIDPTLNNSVTPWTADLRAYNPTYFLVNGRAWTSAAPAIATTAGNRLLLREVNAGVRHHSLASLGIRQSILAADGSELPSPRSVVAETLAPGQSADALVDIPVSTAASTKYALYDGSLALGNGAANGIGGMLMFIDAGPAGSGSDTVGPTTSSLSLVETAPGSGMYTVTAHQSDAATGGANVVAAEYRIDSSVGPSIALSATDGAFDEPDEDVTSGLGQVDTTGWTSGTHTIYVRGQDAIGNWGPNVSATILVDHTGPSTSALTLTPNPSNGSVSIALAGSATDAAAGNGNVVAAEYFLGPTGASGTGTAMSQNTVAPTVSVTATIPAQASSTVVSVHARDAAGNWGPFATIALTVDATGPATSSLAAAPPANNGSYPVSSGNPSVRITATISDAGAGGSKVLAAEGFIDAAVVNGTGFPFLPVDGTFNSPSEAVYCDIPLATINGLTSGNHVIRVHGKDAAGNWGSAATLTYLIDRTAPTFTNISLSPNPTNGATSVTLIVNGANDPLVGGLASGISGGEWWIGTTVPAAGSATAFSGTAATVPVGSLATGTYTVGARIRDAAGNWSVAGTASLLVVPDSIFANGFEAGAVNSTWSWTSKSTNTPARLTVTTTTPMIGTRMLQAQGNNSNYVQYSFGTTAQPATGTYDARFYFNPNNNASTGQDILATATSSGFGTQAFHVRYRRSGTQPQVQIQVGNTANATWSNVTNNAANVIEVTWQAGGSLRLTVNGTLVQTVTANGNSIGAVRLGSVTSGGSSTLMYFDAFASKRTLSPLFGP